MFKSLIAAILAQSAKFFISKKYVWKKYQVSPNIIPQHQIVILPIVILFLSLLFSDNSVIVINGLVCRKPNPLKQHLFTLGYTTCSLLPTQTSLQTIISCKDVTKWLPKVGRTLRRGPLEVLSCSWLFPGTSLMTFIGCYWDVASWSSGGFCLVPDLSRGHHLMVA